MRRPINAVYVYWGRERPRSAASFRKRIHPNQITTWKSQLVAESAEIFTRGGVHGNEVAEEEKAELYQQIGKLQVELDWLQKKSGILRRWARDANASKRNHSRLSIARQCELIGLPRSTWYYEPQSESAENLHLMRLLDEQYTRTPFYGSRRMVIALGDHGWKVNRKRVQRLMQQMGIEAIYPKPRLSDPAQGHRIYPYRLRGLAITQPNQVWRTDITYIRLRNGFVYLVAILD